MNLKDPYSPRLLVAIVSAIIALLLAGLKEPTRSVNIDDTRKGELHCRDENNKPVDWFVVYKLPANPELGASATNGGRAYAYITNKTVLSGWTLSRQDISSISSLTGRTLSPLYEADASKKLTWAIYNDHCPGGPVDAYNGHTKGVVIANSENVLWLIHTVPQFPLLPRTLESKIEDFYPSEYYKYPNTGTEYGQSFMCISTPITNLVTIVKHLMCNQLVLCYFNMLSNTAELYPAFAKLQERIRAKRADKCNIKQTIRSTNGVEFTLFAKNKQWGRDLYSDLVSPGLETSLLVQSMTKNCKESRKLPSVTRNGFSVTNVDYIYFQPQYFCNIDEFTRRTGISFRTNRDHSKWAVSVNDDRNKFWVCIGDINRVGKQMERGGGAVCVQLTSLWNAYKYLIARHERVPGAA